MAEKYGWCKDLPVVDYREKGKHYCVFHAPEGKKGIPVKDFNELIFKRIKDLSGTIFEGDISFREFNLSAVNFSEATFSGKTSFLNTKFSKEANFTSAIFNKNVDFLRTTFYHGVNFSKATFLGDACFLDIILKDYDGIFEMVFADLNIKGKVKFEEVNLRTYSFIDTDLKKIDFINCRWPKKWFGGRRNILYDEVRLYGNQDELRDFSLDKEKIKKVEILYRQLKQKYKEEHNEPEVSNWHFGEKEMQRKGSLCRFFPFSLSNLYWFSSGYGERPFRAGIVLFLLIIAISVFLGLTGIKPMMDNSCVIKIKEWSGIWNLDYLKATIEYATFESKPNFIPENWFLKIAAKLLIPLQAALFALALRNKFRR